MPSVLPIRLADNTVYLAEEHGERVLVDTGPDYLGAREALAETLAGRVPDCVVATHGHLDHAGLGHWWEERGVPVAIGAADASLAVAPQLADAIEFAGFEAWVRGTGAPPEVIAEVMHGLELRRSWANAAAFSPDYPPMGREHRWPSGLRYQHFQPDRLLAEDQTIGAGLSVLLSPGHTPGNLVLIHEAEGWLFSGDTLLAEITPIPAIQAISPARTDDWRFRSLPAFVDSLRRLGERHFSRCFPGHGDPFDGVDEIIDANLAQIELRNQRVAEALAAVGRGTPWSLAETLYPRAVRRRFWQIVATIQGHLDLLEARGAARLSDGAYEIALGS